MALGRVLQRVLLAVSTDVDGMEETAGSYREAANNAGCQHSPMPAHLFCLLLIVTGDLLAGPECLNVSSRGCQESTCREEVSFGNMRKKGNSFKRV